LSRRTIEILFVSALIALGGLACGDKAPKHIAELIEVVEGGATKSSDNVAWAKSSKGDRFKVGDSLKTDDEGVARLLIGGQKLRMGNDTLIQFGGKKIVFFGEIEVDQGMNELGLDFGDAEITTTGTLRIIRRDDQLQFEVLVGDATITQLGDVTVLEPGDELAFEFGDGVMQKIETPIDAGVPDAAPVVEPDAGPEPSASVMATVSGKGVRVRVAEGGKWARLKPGEQEVASKSDVEIKRRSKVLFSRGTDRVNVPGASMAYVDAEDASFVTIKRGRADAHAETAPVKVAIPGGTVELHSTEEVATNVGLEVGNQGTLVEIKTGKATLRAGDKEETITIGESARIHKGQIEVIDRAPKFSHITLGTVSSATLHVVRAPVNVRINFKDHCARAVVEVARGRNFARPAQRRAGKGNAILVMTTGSHRYRVRCYVGDTLSGKAAATGRIGVTRDSGSRPLPRGAPKNTIDADGRRYTVLFQNRLPAITVRWRGAPTASSYTIKISSKGKVREVTASKPQHTYKPGVFNEGNYEYWFVANGKESKHSKLHISFDNAAATGYLSSPKPKAKLTGSEVVVKGAAVLGWTVAVGSQALALDKQYRFDESVPLAPDGLAVRFSHPKYGTHYYVRAR
jgi:hypothetical protein